jgi:hypothetical protein
LKREKGIALQAKSFEGGAPEIKGVGEINALVYYKPWTKGLSVYHLSLNNNLGNKLYVAGLNRMLHQLH